MKPPQALKDFPNLFLGDAACIEAVLQVYSAAEPTEAFEVAMQEWRKRNPMAPPYVATAVIRIICNRD
jgi:hypothetical protein